MEIHRIPGLVCAMTTLLLAATHVFSAEKIQITGSTSVQLPKPNEVLENSRKGRNFDGPSVRSTYEGSLLPGGPVMPSNPQADKKFKEAIDKKKNWIFVNPYETQYDSKTQEFLKGEKATALYNHPLMKDDEKGVVQRFIEEKKQDREFDQNRGDNDRSERAGNSETEPRDLRGNASGELVPGGKQSNDVLNRGLVLTSPLEQKSLLAQERDPFQERLERNPLSDNLLGGNSRAEDRTTFTKEERAARDAELSKIYQPRIGPTEGGISAVPGASDPLNTFDVTRQEATPFSGRRTDQLFNVGRAESSSFGAGRNSPVFTGPPISAPGSGLNSRLGERAGFDFNVKAPQASAFAPSVSAPRPSDGWSAKPAPFVLPLPQRKF